MSFLSASAKEIKAFVALFIVLAFIAVVNGVPFIFGDAYGYYHVSKTEITQGLYPSSVQPEYYQYSGHAVYVANNKYVTPYSVGQSMLYFPFLLTAQFFNTGTVYTNYYKAFNGHTLADGIAILSAAVLSLYLAIIFCYLFLREIGFTKKVSFYSTIAVATSLYLISYSFEQPGYSHVYEFFAYSAFLYFFVKFFFSKRPKFLYVATLLAGFLVLIRIVDVSLLLIPFLFVLYKIRSKKVLITTALLTIFSVILFFVYNYISYGSPFTLGYTAGGSSGFGLSFNVLNLLFSDTRGLFIWSPLTILGLVGLIWYSIKSKVALLFFFAPMLLLLAIYNFWGNWWGGISAGQRFLIVLAPIFALGVAYLYTEFRFKFIIKLLAFVLVVFGLVSSLLYRITPITKMNAQFRTDSTALTTPANEDYRLTDLYRYHARLITHATGISSYLKTLTEGLNGGRSLALLSLGLTDPLVRVDAISDLQYKIYFIPNNVNKDVSINLFVTISHNNISRTYLISSKSFVSPSNSVINCDTALNCTADNVELLPAIADATKLDFAAVNSTTMVSVYGENVRVNYVNTKLK